MSSNDELRADSAGTRWFRKQVTGSVAAVTVRVEDGFRATSVSAFLVASIDPPQILVSLERYGQMIEWIEKDGKFALSLLSRRDQFLADRFAGFAPLASQNWSEIPHMVAATGSPILEHAIAWVDCTVSGIVDTGDHRCVIGDIVALGSGHGNSEETLLYFQGRYRRLHDLSR